MTTVALAAARLRCVFVERYRTTTENSGDRGKRKGARGKRRGAMKTKAFVAVDAFFNKFCDKVWKSPWPISQTIDNKDI